MRSLLLMPLNRTGSPFRPSGMQGVLWKTIVHCKVTASS